MVRSALWNPRWTTVRGVAISLAIIVAGQAVAAQTPKTPAAPKAAKAPKGPSGFFDTENVFTATLTTNLAQIRRDKGDDAPWRAATLTYTDSAGKPRTVPLQIKTRGIWRLKNCEFPPLRLNFSGEAAKGTVFKKLDKPKLVNYCRDIDIYDQYILQELELYRAYNLLTPFSHKVRLLQLTYADSATHKVLAVHHAFIVEEPAVMAERNAAKIVEAKNLGPGDFDPSLDALVGVFQYMIGNTDYAVAALHNLEVVMRTGGFGAPVVYDFDFAGAVNARYAVVDPRLSIKAVRERLMQGYCVAPSYYATTFALFNQKKPAIYALYHDPIGALLPPKIVTETLKYFDDFYRTINDPRSAKAEIVGACIARKG